MGYFFLRACYFQEFAYTWSSLLVKKAIKRLTSNLLCKQGGLEVIVISSSSPAVWMGLTCWVRRDFMTTARVQLQTGVSV